ncbi:hypothetical protein EUGRSUZ_B02765 [Eucalyptus grandis]|uniref:Uncharacterized protein n=2 Tax=Eucalyptus grandis TaxID=71139 RepID=A0ACC3M1Z2_EUCGR|nr:hypothetical protein EUGRSUZ_B02765 [Eucalyptus grandis]
MPPSGVPDFPRNGCRHGGSEKAGDSLCRFKIIAVRLLPSALGSVRLAGRCGEDGSNGFGWTMSQTNLFFSRFDVGFSVLSKLFLILFLFFLVERPSNF